MTSAELAGLGSADDFPITRGEILSALTFALDLTEGAAPGHGLRCCLLGMRLATAIGLTGADLPPLYYALLLKDIGCSTNASRMALVTGGDDRAVKGVAKITDWTSVVRSAHPRTVLALWKHVLPGAPVHRRMARLVDLAVHQRENNRTMIELRCERGRDIVRKLRLPETTAQAIYHLDEHWDGKGYPDGLQRHAIPLLSRLCAVAQNLDLFATVDGPEAALSVLQSRSGTWFDPGLVKAAETLHRAHALWHDALASDSEARCRELVSDMQPDAEILLEDDVDTICAAFAEVVDAKSPYTYRHSERVAEVAVALGRALLLPEDQLRRLRRLGWLHDLGKLGIPNTILDKPGPLVGQEWTQMRDHVRQTRAILERIPSFTELAVVAGEHHEKMDGSGYPQGLRAKDLSLESRILGLADQFAGMTERRPYHPGYDARSALELIRMRVPAKVDERCFAALEFLVEAGMSSEQLTADLLVELA